MPGTEHFVGVGRTRLWKSGVWALVCCIALAAAPADLSAAGDKPGAKSEREERLAGRERQEEDEEAELQWSNAETAYLIKDHDTARKLYLAIVRQYPDSDYGVRALARIGDVYRAQKTHKQAIEFYQKMVTKYRGLGPEQKERLLDDYVRTRYLIGATYYDEKNYRRVFGEMRRFIQDFPDSQYANVAYFLIGESHIASQNFRAAIKAFDSVGTARQTAQQGGLEALISPGDLLYVQVEDPDMRTAAMGQIIKVRVTTTSGDVENIMLSPKGIGSPLFVGNIKTCLGVPRQTAALEELWSIEVDAELDRALRTAKELERRAEDLKEEREALKKKMEAIAKDKSLSGKEQLEAVGKVKDQISERSENIIASQRRADKERRETYARVDAAFVGVEKFVAANAPDKTIEAVTKKLQDAKEKAEAEKAAAEAAEEEDLGGEQAGRKSKRVFSEEEILKIRTEAGMQPTNAGNFEGRRSILRYWAGKLLYDLKRLEVMGSDKINVLYRDEHVTSGRGEQVRKDVIALASDGFVRFAAEDLKTAVFKEVYSSPVHVQVIDPDQDVSNEKDTVEVTLSVVQLKKAQPKDEKDEAKKKPEGEEQTEGQAHGGQPEYVETYAPERRYEVLQKETAEGETTKEIVEVEEEEEMPPLAPPGAPSAKVTLTETEPHSGTFVAVLAGTSRGVEVAGKEMIVSPEQRLRAAYEDGCNVSRRKPWVVWSAVDFVPSSEGDVAVPEITDSKLNRRAQLEKGISEGELAKVYEDLGLADMARLYYEKALRTCGRVAQLEGLTPLGQEATHTIWRIYFESGQPDKAVAACQQLIREFPKSDLVDEAYLTMGKALMGKAEEATEREKGRYAQQAIAALNGLLRAKPDSEYKPEALYTIGEALYMAGEGGAEYMEKVVREHADSPFAALALQTSGDHAYSNSDFASAYEYFTRILVDYPDARDLDKTMLMRGHCQVKMRDYPEALRAYYELIESYPGSRYSKTAQKIIDYIKKKMAQAESQ